MAESILHEEWKPIKRFGGVYEVSNLGRVRRSGGKGKGTVVGRIVQAYPNQKGYMKVVLYIGGAKRNGKKYLSVHRLVAEAFLPPDPLRPHVNHKDHNKANNRARNLEWCTPLENTRHAVRSGRFENRKPRGPWTSEALARRLLKWRSTWAKNH